MEANLCRDQKVVVVGGGNSAGQAALFLSRTADHVHLIIRGKSIASAMSRYLVTRIMSSARITIHTQTEIERLDGDASLRCVTWVDHRTGLRETRQVSNVFVMIGAEPNSGWLYGTLALDKNGFILTGAPNSFEDSRYATNVPGIYAVGDVRSDSVKRVAAAVGEGSVVISDVHRYLATQAETFTGGAVGQAAPSTRDAPQLSQRSTPERNLLLRKANIAIFRENSSALVSLPSHSLLYESEAQDAGPVRIQASRVFESICIAQ